MHCILQDTVLFTPIYCSTTGLAPLSLWIFPAFRYFFNISKILNICPCLDSTICPLNHNLSYILLKLCLPVSSVTVLLKFDYYMCSWNRYLQVWLLQKCMWVFVLKFYFKLANPFVVVSDSLLRAKLWFYRIFCFLTFPSRFLDFLFNMGMNWNFSALVTKSVSLVSNSASYTEATYACERG